jgi:putative ABC transport system permease protein
MDSLVQDLRIGARLLMRHRGFAATAILTLAVCIGANAAVFAIVNAVLLRPLAVPEPQRLVHVYNSYPNAGVERASTGVPDYFDRLRDTTAFEELSLSRQTGATIGGDAPERVSAAQATPSFFRMLRVTPAQGRIFVDDEGEEGKDLVALVSHAFWQQRFGERPLGAATDLRINDRPYRIVGVLPPGFRFADFDARVWLPARFTPEEKEARHSNNWTMIGRLKAGATIAEAQAQIDALNAANDERFPEMREILHNAGFHTVVVPLQNDLVREVRPALSLLWGGVLFVLLIGCVNLTNLLLVRSSARAREIATRTALGAGWWRLGRQLVTETLLIAAAGALLGLVIGRALVTLLAGASLASLPRGDEVALDGSVMTYTTALAAVVAFAISLVPMLHLARVDLNAVFREESRGATTSRSTRIVRGILVTTQVAVAFVLLVGAGLLLESFRQVLKVDPGFNPEGVLSGRMNPPTARYEDDAAYRSFMSRALQSVRALPGVRAVGAASSLPLSGDGSDSVILAEGYEMSPGESLISPNYSQVTPGYFEAMGIPLLRGRRFDSRDTDSSMRAVIVDQRLAERFWPDQDPVGRRMWQPASAEDLVAPGPNAVWHTVVGVVGPVKARGLARESVGMYYLPYAQSSSQYFSLVIKSDSDPEPLTVMARRALAEVDAEVPLYDVKTMNERLDDSVLDRRTPMLLSVTFAAIALFLAAVGIYGVLAYQVSLRTKEIGIRLALGSNAGGIFRLVLGEGALLLVIGLVVGVAGAVALRRAFESQLFAVSATDPMVMVLVIGRLALVTLLACALPARRAARVDPVTALNEA